MHARARLHHVCDDEADDKREGGEGEKVDHRLAGDAADLGEIGHAGNPGRDRQEDHRRDDHLHEPDEGVAKRFELRADIRIEMPEQDARGDRRQHLNIEMAVKGCLAADLRGMFDDHDILHVAGPVRQHAGPPGPLSEDRQQWLPCGACQQHACQFAAEGLCD